MKHFIKAFDTKKLVDVKLAKANSKGTTQVPLINNTSIQRMFNEEEAPQSKPKRNKHGKIEYIHRRR